MIITTIVVILIILGGALPLLGLGRVARRAKRNLPGADRVSAVDQMEEGNQTGLYPMGPFVRAAQMTDTAPILEWSRVRWDLAFVGGGVLCGATGSVWAVFL